MSSSIHFFVTDIKRYGLFQFKVELKTVLQILGSIHFHHVPVFHFHFHLVCILYLYRTHGRTTVGSFQCRTKHVLLMIPASALATTVNTLVSNLIGANEGREVLLLSEKWHLLHLYWFYH